MRVADRGLPPHLREAGVTRREADVLEALAGRLPNREIAEQLFLSVRTVESHVSSLLAKLQAADRGELAMIARTAVVGPSTSGRMPLSLLELAERTPLIGRQQELGLLRQLWAEAAAGRPRVAFVFGEAGIGKSRLVAELAVAADRHGALVVMGHCDERPLAPYQTMVEIVSGLVEALPADELAAAADGIGPEVAGLVPALAPFASQASRLDAGPAAMARYRLFDQLGGILIAAARNTPLLLVIEDLQWADPTAVGFIRHLMRRADRTRLLLVGTMRGTQMDGPQLELAAELRRETASRLVLLHGLDVAEVSDLILTRRRAAETGLAEQLSGLADQLHAETGGNPLFVEELLDHLLAQPDPLSRAIRNPGVPATIRDLIVRRAASLGDFTREVLAIAAVLGRRFRADHVVRTARADREQVMAALDEARAAGILATASDRPGWMEFSHALVRETLEVELSSSRRQQLHRLVAQILEADDAVGYLPEVAHHLHAAGFPADYERAVTHATAAAEDATRRLAHELAADMYAKALDALALAPAADYHRQFDLLLRQAEAHQRAGSQDLAEHVASLGFALAQRLEDHVRMADAALVMAASAPTWPADPQLVDALEAALNEVPEDDLRRRALLLARLAQAEYYSAPAPKRASISDQAVALARKGGDDATLATVLSARRALLWNPNDAHERLSIAADIVAIARRLGDDELALQGYAWRIVDLFEVGDLDGVDRAFRAHGALAQRRGEPLHIRDGALWNYTRALLDGRFADAERHSRQALLLGQRVGDPHAEMFRSVQRLWLALEYRASRHEFADVIAETSLMAERYPHVPAWRAKLALLHARAGDRDAAQVLFSQLSVRHFAALPRDAVWIGGLYYLGEVAAFLGDRSAARTLYELLLPFAGRMVVIDRALVCLGSISRALGLLAGVLDDRPAASEHLRHALAVHDAMGARPLTARTRFELARLEREDPASVARATEQLALARASAVELGMSLLVAQMDGLGH
jgi:DNA-binding CsgD family transcriptional regulator